MGPDESGSGATHEPRSQKLNTAGVTDQRGREDPMDDRQTLSDLNLRFIEAFRQGSWEVLEPILSPSFSYLDGASGDVWSHERYVDTLRSNPAPALAIDQVSIHVDGNTAVVSARTSRQPGIYRRYVDTYERRPDGWLCVHACVWPLVDEREPVQP